MTNLDARKECRATKELCAVEKKSTLLDKASSSWLDAEAQILFTLSDDKLSYITAVMLCCSLRRAFVPLEKPIATQRCCC